MFCISGTEMCTLNFEKRVYVFTKVFIYNAILNDGLCVIRPSKSKS